MLIDTHCHLSEVETDDLVGVITRMKDNIMIISGVDIKSDEEVLEMTQKYPNIYGTIGIYPGEVQNMKETDMDRLEQLIQNDKIVGIGEIGLDYHYGKDTMDLQKELFRKQIGLARKYNKAIVVHSRDAALDTYDILKEESVENMNVVMHCYSYSYEMAKRLIELGVKLGIGGVLTFSNSKVLKEVVKNIPLESLVLETDSPYLAPSPFRGHTNEPSYVIYVAEKIAEIKGISVEEVILKTTLTACSEFDLNAKI